MKSTQILSFMTPGAGLHVLGRGREQYKLQ